MKDGWHTGRRSPSSQFGKRDGAKFKILNVFIMKLRPMPIFLSKNLDCWRPKRDEFIGNWGEFLDNDRLRDFLPSLPNLDLSGYRRSQTRPVADA